MGLIYDWLAFLWSLFCDEVVDVARKVQWWADQ